VIQIGGAKHAEFLVLSALDGEEASAAEAVACRPRWKNS